MTTAPLVTVGIPFWNEERLLASAMRSILRQTYGNLEILLVDDGSTDRSVDVARAFDDPRVTVRTDGQRRYLAARLNEIARHARGQFIARMDADDVAHPTRIERQVERLLRNEHCSAVGSWTGLIDGNDEPFGIIEAHVPVSPRVALERGVLPHPTLIARREWVLAHPYDETLTRTEDRELLFRTLAATHYDIVPEPLYALRLVANDPAFLRKYLAGQRENRRLFLRHGPETMGGPATARAWMASHAKSLTMRLAGRLDLAPRVVRRRGRAPTAEERKMIQEAIDASRQ